jgi:hypothetical protein
MPKFLITLILLAGCCTRLLAQDSTDSVIDTAVVKSIPEKNDSIKNYKKEKDFAYINYLDSLLRKTKDLTVDTFSLYNTGQLKKQKRSTTRIITPTPNNFLNAPLIKIILWALAIFFVGFILYRLFLSDFLFRKKPVSKNTLVEEKEEEDVSDISVYDRRILKAEMDRNFRLAIRYFYLQTLQMLSGKGSIQLSSDKTNYQYVRELSNRPYQNDFAGITLNYEYVWYGKFEINEEVYHKLRKDYKSLQQKI